MIEQKSQVSITTLLSVISISISIISIIIAAICARFTITMKGAQKRTEILLKLYDAQRSLKLYQERISEFEEVSNNCKLKPDNALAKRAKKLSDQTKKQYENILNKTNLNPIKAEHLIADTNILLSDINDFSKQLTSIISSCQNCDVRQIKKDMTPP